MGLFKKLVNYSRQYNSNPQPSRSGSSSSTVRKVCLIVYGIVRMGPMDFMLVLLFSLFSLDSCCNIKLRVKL